jgi:hypothetical protein
MIPSVNSAFKQWVKPKSVIVKRIKYNQNAEMLRRNGRCIRALLREAGIYPLLLINYDKSNVLTRQQCDNLVEYIFGEKAFVDKPSWPKLWRDFREKLIRSLKLDIAIVVDELPLDELFIIKKYGTQLNLSKCDWDLEIIAIRNMYSLH